MADENKLSHLEALRKDVRDEVKRRIQQRDQYSMQLTVALGAIAIGAFSVKGTPRFFVFVPMVSIYFTALILYSYRIHDMLASYLRSEIEPEFESLCNIPVRKEWETWYGGRRRPGIRRWFFVVEMWVVSLLSLAFVWYKEWCAPGWFKCTLILATVAYLVLALWTSFLLRKEKNN
jgi:hypothetical protein